MRQVFKWVSGPALAATLFLSGCGAGLPGVEVVEPSASAAASTTEVSEADVQKTVQAQVEATIRAQQSAAPSASVEPSATSEASASVEASAAASAAATPTEEATEEPTEAATAEASDAARSAAPAASRPAATGNGEGEIVLVGRNNTVSWLTNGQWNTFDLKTIENSQGNSCLNGATAFFDQQGSPWVTCSTTVYRPGEGNTWVEYDGDERGRGFIDPQGRVWLVFSAKIFVQDDGQWTTYEAKDTINAEFYPNESVAFAADGTVYLVGPSSDAEMVSFNGSEWKNYGGEITGDRGNPQSVLVTSKGDVLIGTSQGVYKLNGDQLEDFVTADQIGAALGENIGYNGDIRDLAETPDGLIWLSTKGGIASWDGSALKAYGVAEGLPAFEAEDLTVDGSGALWATTVHGIAVFKDGAWQAAVPGTSNIGDGFNWTVAVKGAPALPAPGEEKTLTITGRVVANGKPLANTDVELCSEEPGFFKYRADAETPCANQFYYKLVQTDAQGVYRLENVPIGSYEIIARDDEGRWTINIFDDQELLEPGAEVTKDLDLGD